MTQITYDQINFETVQELYWLAHSDRFNDFHSENYSDEDRKIALQYLLEETLWDFRKGTIDAFILKMMGKGVPFGKDMFILLQPVFELSLKEAGPEARETLLPLFFSSDLSTKHSFIIDDEELRDSLFEVYEKVIRKEGKEISDLKQLYLSNYPFSYLMPLIEHLTSMDAREEDQSAIGQAAAPSKDISSVREEANQSNLPNVLSSVLFLLGKVLLLLFAWSLIFIAWPQSGKIELPTGVQWLLAIGATVWIWFGANSWRKNRHKRR